MIPLSLQSIGGMKPERRTPGIPTGAAEANAATNLGQRWFNGEATYGGTTVDTQVLLQLTTCIADLNHFSSNRIKCF